MLNNDLHALLYDGADAFYRINPVNNAVKLSDYLISTLSTAASCFSVSDELVSEPMENIDE